MNITKNSMTAKDIDVLFQKTYCNFCVDSGFCEGCIIYAALDAAEIIDREIQESKSEQSGSED